MNSAQWGGGGRGGGVRGGGLGHYIYMDRYKLQVIKVTAYLVHSIFFHLFLCLFSSRYGKVNTKGVGPGTTSTWFG